MHTKNKFTKKIRPSLHFLAAMEAQTFWYGPGRVATAYSTDKYKYQRMKIRLSWVGQSTRVGGAGGGGQSGQLKMLTSWGCFKVMRCITTLVRGFSFSSLDGATESYFLLPHFNQGFDGFIWGYIRTLSTIGLRKVYLSLWTSFKVKERLFTDFWDFHQSNCLKFVNS